MAELVRLSNPTHRARIVAKTMFRFLGMWTEYMYIIPMANQKQRWFSKWTVET